MFAERHKQCLKDMLEAECGSHSRTERAGAGRPLQEQGQTEDTHVKEKNEGDEGRDEERRKGGRKKGRQKIAFVYNLTPY